MAKIDEIKEELRKRISEILIESRLELSADIVTFFLYDWETDQFYLPVGEGLYDKDTFEHPRMMPRRGRAARKVVREQKPLFAQNAENHPQIGGAFIFREEIKSSAGYPMISDKTVFGVLFISYRQHQSFDRQMQDRIGMIVEKQARRLYKQIDFEKITEKGFFFTEKTEDESIYQTIADLTCESMDRPAAIWCLDPEDQILRIEASTGIPPSYAQKASAKLGDGSVISKTVESGKSLYVNEITTDDTFPYRKTLRESNLKSSITHPVHVRNQAIGVIELFSFYENEFADDVFEPYKRNTLRHLSKMAGFIIEREVSSVESKWLAEMADEISGSFDFNQIIRVIVKAARKITFAHSSVITFLSDESSIFGSLDTHSCFAGSDCHLCHNKALAQYIVAQGLPLVIKDTEDVEEIKNDEIAELVRSGMKQKGIRSLIGVPVDFRDENFGVLYICSQRSSKFNDYHVTILNDLANQLSIVIGRPHQFLRVAQEIDDAISDLSKRKQVLDDFCKGIKAKFDFGYVTVSRVRFEENIVETVAGLEFGKKWSGLSKHPLLRDEDIPVKSHPQDDSEHYRARRDIQADIVLSDPPRAEIISGWDYRFDPWIYKEFQHDKIVRITAPIILLLDQKGNVVEDWPDYYEWKIVKDVIKPKDGGQHTILELQTKDGASDEKDQYDLRIIGTVGAGYHIDEKERIEPEEAIALNQYVAKNISKFRKILLISVLKKIVERSTKFSLAESASLHFAFNPNSEQYSYEVCSGKIGLDFMENCSPRKKGLGRKALDTGVAQFISKPEGSQKNEEEISDEKQEYGIKAEAVFPIEVGDNKGLLYVYFHRDHLLTENEKEWLGFFAHKAQEAIEHATTYTESNDRTLQLRTLSKISRYLSRKSTFEKKLLPFIANSTRNLLAADLVIIYEYDMSRNTFDTAPEISGILYEDIDGRSPVTEESAPMLLVAEKKTVYEPNVKQNPIFFSESGLENFDKPLFVHRENIKSAAGILLQSDEEILGVMFVNYRRIHRFADHEKEIIETLASSTALAIKNQRSIKNRQDELMALAHDYKGSLLPIIGHLYNIKDHNLPDAIKDDFDYALNFAEILSITSLSTYKWLSQRAGIDKFGGVGRFDAVAELKKFTKMLQFIKDRSDLKFAYVEESYLPQELVNEEIFKIVTYNLLENAFKYADHSSTIKIALRFEEHNHKLEIRIRSVGEPIKPEEKEKIFEKFERGEVLLGRVKDGTGFGLWSARKFLRSVGGDIYLDQPNPPKTNEFVVTIPQIHS